jgi:hypothetical protein
MPAIMGPGVFRLTRIRRQGIATREGKSRFRKRLKFKVGLQSAAMINFQVGLDELIREVVRLVRWFALKKLHTKSSEIST